MSHVQRLIEEMEGMSLVDFDIGCITSAVPSISLRKSDEVLIYPKGVIHIKNQTIALCPSLLERVVKIYKNISMQYDESLAFIALKSYV